MRSRHAARRSGDPSPRVVSTSAPPTCRWWWLLGWACTAGFALVTVLVLATDGHDRFDRTVLAGVAATRTGPVSALLVDVAWLGSPPVLATVALLGASLLWRRTRGPLVPATFVGALAGTAVAVLILEVAVSRIGPAARHVSGPVALLGSFPSASTADGTVLWGLAAALAGYAARTRVLRLAAAAAGVLVVGAIGVSRVCLGYHWPTDVLAGWLLGTAILSGVIVLLAGSAGAGPGTGPQRTRVAVR